MKHLLAALCVCLFFASCKISDKNLVFATNASFGVDLDSAPTTINIGYARDELSVAPLTEEGEVLPVMASFSAGANFIDTMFAAGISQSFAVGNAAHVLSKYFLSALNAAGDPEEEDPMYFNDASASGVHGKRQKEKCYVFGTTTTIGLRLGISNANMISIGVDSLSFGYKRKELAFVPITEKEVPLTEHASGVKQVVPPLIATLVGNAQAGSAGNGLGAAQLYATGHAATYLAAEPGVRGAIGQPFVREKEVQEALQQVSLAKLRETVLRAQQDLEPLIEKDKAQGEAWSLIEEAAKQNKLDEARAALKEAKLGDIDGWDGLPDDAEKVKRLKRATRLGDDDGDDKKNAVVAFGKELRKKLNEN